MTFPAGDFLPCSPAGHPGLP